MPPRPFKCCRLFRWWQVPVALILSVTISLSQPVFTGCFRGEGFRLAGTRVFCRGNRTEKYPLDVVWGLEKRGAKLGNRAEKDPLEANWGLEKRGARMGNGKPQAALSHDNWLVDRSTDNEVPEIEGEGAAVGEAGLTRAGKGLSAESLAKPGQPHDPFERGSLMASIEEHLEVGVENDQANIPSERNLVQGNSLGLGKGKSSEILETASARGGSGFEEEESGLGKGTQEKIGRGERDSTAREEDQRGKEKPDGEGGGFRKRGEPVESEEEDEIEDGNEIANGEGNVKEEGKTIKEEATEGEELWIQGIESSAKRYEPSTKEMEESNVGEIEAEGKDGRHNMEELVASEKGPGAGLLVKAAEDESEDVRKDGGVRPQENWELRMRRAEDDRPHPSCRPHELVYVYDLPSEFNVALFGPSCGAAYLAFQLARNACVIYSPEFGGIGPRLTGTETAFLSDIGSPADSWADTGQFGLEVMFHQYMLDAYPCRTTSGEDAAAFYVPIYTGMLHLNRTVHCGIDTCPEVSPLGWAGRLLGAHLNRLPYLRRYKGRDHITTMGRCTYDGLQDDTCCTNGLLKTKHTKRFVIMGIESNDLTSKERQVSIPYPTCFHPATREEITAHQQLILSANRTVLINFTGQIDRDALWQGRNLRRRIAEQCAAQPGNCELVNCGTECYCTTVLGGQLWAHFCLQPPGDTPTRRSFFDSLQAGCVPVLFQRASAYDEYTSFLPSDESSYSVFIPESDVIWGGADIIETLRRIPEAELERKRAVIASMLTSISYEDHGRARERARRAAAEPRESLPETVNSLGEKSAYGVALAEALMRVERALDAAAAEASN